MNRNNTQLLEMLPEELRQLSILPRHKTLLTRRRIGEWIWIVLLTEMPGQKPMAWKLTPQHYYSINPKHGSRERWVRENLPPDFQADANPKRFIQLSLLL